MGQRCSVVFSALPDDGILRRVTEELLPALQSQGEGGPRKQQSISRKKFGNTMFVEFEGWFQQTRDTLNRCLGEACRNMKNDEGMA